jgi:hypothetical protein
MKSTQKGHLMARYATKRKPKPPARRSLLPLWLVLAGLALAALAAAGFWNNTRPGRAGVQAGGGPRLWVEPEVIDHGNVRLNTRVKDAIRVTNAGDRPLIFTEAPYVQVLEGC